MIKTRPSALMDGDAYASFRGLWPIEPAWWLYADDKLLTDRFGREVRKGDVMRRVSEGILREYAQTGVVVLFASEILSQQRYAFLPTYADHLRNMKSRKDKGVPQPVVFGKELRDARSEWWAALTAPINSITYDGIMELSAVSPLPVTIPTLDGFKRDYKVPECYAGDMYQWCDPSTYIRSAPIDVNPRPPVSYSIAVRQSTIVNHFVSYNRWTLMVGHRIDQMISSFVAGFPVLSVNPVQQARPMSLEVAVAMLVTSRQVMRNDTRYVSAHFPVPFANKGVKGYKFTMTARRLPGGAQVMTDQSSRIPADYEWMDEDGSKYFIRTNLDPASIFGSLERGLCYTCIIAGTWPIPHPASVIPVALYSISNTANPTFTRFQSALRDLFVFNYPTRYAEDVTEVTRGKWSDHTADPITMVTELGSEWQAFTPSEYLTYARTIPDSYNLEYGHMPSWTPVAYVEDNWTYYVRSPRLPAGWQLTSIWSQSYASKLVHSGRVHLHLPDIYWYRLRVPAVMALKGRTIGPISITDVKQVNDHAQEIDPRFAVKWTVGGVEVNEIVGSSGHAINQLLFYSLTKRSSFIRWCENILIHFRDLINDTGIMRDLELNHLLSEREQELFWHSIIEYLSVPDVYLSFVKHKVVLYSHSAFTYYVDIFIPNLLDFASGYATARERK
jgi:hypothetical protein